MASWRMCVFVCFLLVLKYLKHVELYNLCFWGIISSSSYFPFVGIANVLHHRPSPGHYFLSPEMLYLVFNWFSFFSLSFLLIEKINEDNLIYLFISSKGMFSEGKVDTIFAYTCPPTDTSKDVKIQILNTTSRTLTKRVLHVFPDSFCTIWVT